MTVGSKSSTEPREPRDPSVVATDAERPVRRAVSAPNTRSALSAPSRKSAGQARSVSRAASANSGAAPAPTPTSRHETGSRGTGKGRPKGPTMSSTSRERQSASHWVPGSRGRNTNSTVPPWSGRTSCTENVRRASMPDCGPPTAIAMNWPGRNLVAIAGATTVMATYASTRRTVSTVPRTCTGATPPSRSLPAIQPPPRPSLSPTLSSRSAGRFGRVRRLGRPAQRGGVLLQGADADLATDDGLDALHRRRQASHGGHARDAPADGRGPDLVPVEPDRRRRGREAAPGGVHDQVYLTLQDPRNHGRLAAGGGAVAVLAHDLGTNAVSAQYLRRA